MVRWRWRDSFKNPAFPTDWTPTTFINLVQKYHMDEEVARHIDHYYGDQSSNVATLTRRNSEGRQGIRLLPDFPYIEAEVIYAVRHEYAVTLTDVLSRRLRLAFQDVQACRSVLNRVAEIMAAELKWSEAEKKSQISQMTKFLDYQTGGDILQQIKKEARELRKRNQLVKKVESLPATNGRVPTDLIHNIVIEINCEILTTAFKEWIPSSATSTLKEEFINFVHLLYSTQTENANHLRINEEKLPNLTGVRLERTCGEL